MKSRVCVLTLTLFLLGILMATPVLKIAKEGEDVTTASEKDLVLDSSKILPKIYAVKKFTPSSNSITASHGLTYPPVYIAYREARYLIDNNSLFSVFSPYRYSFEGGMREMTPAVTQFVDSSNFIDTNTWIGDDDDRPYYVTFFLDPLKAPASDPLPTTTTFPRFKVGDSVDTQADYKNRIDSKYNTLKEYKRGTLTLNLAAKSVKSGDTANTGDNQLEWASVSHGLNYPPIFAPFGVPAIGLDLNLCYNGELSDIPSTLNVNDINNLMAQERDYSTIMLDNLEYIFLLVDSSNLYLGYRRLTFSSTTVTLPARTVTVDYIIFENSITEEYNLL